MAVTAIQISDYLDDVYEAQSKFMDKVVKKEKLGYLEIYNKRALSAILKCYIDIVTDYFSQPSYSGGYFLTTYNFFDEEEIRDVIFRINRICNTDNYLDL